MLEDPFKDSLSLISFSRSSVFNEDEDDSERKLEEEDFLSVEPSFLPLL